MTLVDFHLSITAEIHCFNFHSASIWWEVLKALANEDTLLRTHCCRHKCFPVCLHGQHLLRTQILCPDTKNVSDFVQKHFVSTNVSQFAQPKKHHEQQWVRNNVFSFARALKLLLWSLLLEFENNNKNFQKLTNNKYQGHWAFLGSVGSSGV